jgi:hypothetical protein
MNSNAKEGVMRNLYLYIALGLLLSSATFASDSVSCTDRIPNSRNFIISGAFFREIIDCLENLIETRHASTHTTIKAQDAMTAKKKPAKKNIPTEDDLLDDLLSSVSIQLIRQSNDKKILAFSLSNKHQDKTFELVLN